MSAPHRSSVWIDGNAARISRFVPWSDASQGNPGHLAGRITLERAPEVLDSLQPQPGLFVWFGRRFSFRGLRGRGRLLFSGGSGGRPAAGLFAGLASRLRSRHPGDARRDEQYGPTTSWYSVPKGRIAWLMFLGDSGYCKVREDGSPPVVITNDQAPITNLRRRESESRRRVSQPTTTTETWPLTTGHPQVVGLNAILWYRLHSLRDSGVLMNEPRGRIPHTVPTVKESSIMENRRHSSRVSADHGRHGHRLLGRRRRPGRGEQVAQRPDPHGLHRHRRQGVERFGRRRQERRHGRHLRRRRAPAERRRRASSPRPSATPTSARCSTRWARASTR